MAKISLKFKPPKPEICPDERLILAALAYDELISTTFPSGATDHVMNAFGDHVDAAITELQTAAALVRAARGQSPEVAAMMVHEEESDRIRGLRRMVKDAEFERECFQDAEDGVKRILAKKRRAVREIAEFEGGKLWKAIPHRLRYPLEYTDEWK